MISGKPSCSAGENSGRPSGSFAVRKPSFRIAGPDPFVALGREGKQQVTLDAERNPHSAAMAAKLQTPGGKAAYRRRKWIAEPPNGWIKHILGFRQFSVRGLERVKAEWKLVCLALNLRRMGALMAT